MKIQITKTHETVEEVEVSLPYYYKDEHWHLDWESVAYGRIDEKIHTKIEFDGHWHHIEKAEVTNYKPNWNECSCYLKEEYKSTEAEFLAAKGRAMEILSRA
jgi:hypothetical protein